MNNFFIIKEVIKEKRKGQTSTDLNVVGVYRSFGRATKNLLNYIDKFSNELTNTHFCYNKSNKTCVFIAKMNEENNEDMLNIYISIEKCKNGVVFN